MKIGLFTPLRSPVATPEFLRNFGQKAEEIGVHSFWLGEHVVIFDQYESQYPGSSDGVFRFPEGSGLMDMVSSIGFLAACTSTLRLGTGICHSRLLVEWSSRFRSRRRLELGGVRGMRGPLAEPREAV